MNIYTPNNVPKCTDPLCHTLDRIKDIDGCFSEKCRTCGIIIKQIPSGLTSEEYEKEIKKIVEGLNI